MYKNLLSKFVQSDGWNHEQDELSQWKYLEVATKEIKVKYFDAFRKVQTNTSASSYAIRFRPILIFSIGKEDFAILDLHLSWRFVNEIIYPEKLSFSDYKGILELFIPISMLTDLLVEASQRKLKMIFQKNIEGNNVIVNIHSSLVDTHYKPLHALVESLLGKTTTRQYNYPCFSILWGNSEIEIREEKNKFMIAGRYTHESGHIIQPKKFMQFSGRWDNMVAKELKAVFLDFIDALEQLPELLKNIHTEEILSSFGKYPIRLSIVERNEIEKSRYDTIISYL
tara:strand:- start:5703 stop:6551 length:849 start_codon:yes stop_codon:yes gene_type:complete